MDTAATNLIRRLHQAPYRYVLVLTGGGASAAGRLLGVPGGSRTVLEVAVPYAEESLAEYLGQHPESACSAATARRMAARALERAGWLAPGLAVAGVACTASLRSDRPKRGEHRFHVGVRTAWGTTTHSLTLTKEARTREGEEEVVAVVVLNALAAALGVPDGLEVPLLPGEEVVTEAHPAEGPFGAFLAGKLPALCVAPDGRMLAGVPAPKVVLPGSFNPLHEGHTALAAAGARLAGAPAAFEMTVVNADKPPLPEGEVRRRVAQFAWKGAVWLTRAPTFAEKAQLFPGAVFVVGADTAERVVHPRFYGGSAERMAEALAGIRARGCSFLTAGRVGRGGEFVGLEDLDIPAEHRDLFRGVPAEEFRVDVSSTDLRARAAAGGSLVE
jgi:nicotinamide mononucleotide (NMN) deamidase PncC